MSRWVFSRFARRCRMATLITVCLVGAAFNEGQAGTQAATRTDHVETSRPSVRVPGQKVFTVRFDDAPAFLAGSIRESVALQAPASGLAKLPFAARFTPAGDPVEGTASTYNPADPGDRDAGGDSTASGEKYDPEGWSAAIRTDLRDRFGFGKGSCRSTYALVETADKRLIVRINDVGPLRAGRVIDLNVRAMRYFDPTLELGLIKRVKVTPLVLRSTRAETLMSPARRARPTSP